MSDTRRRFFQDATMRGGGPFWTEQKVSRSGGKNRGDGPREPSHGHAPADGRFLPMTDARTVADSARMDGGVKVSKERRAVRQKIAPFKTSTRWGYKAASPGSDSSETGRSSGGVFENRCRNATTRNWHGMEDTPSTRTALHGSAKSR